MKTSWNSTCWQNDLFSPAGIPWFVFQREGRTMFLKPKVTLCVSLVLMDKYWSASMSTFSATCRQLCDVRLHCHQSWLVVGSMRELMTSCESELTNVLPIFFCFVLFTFKSIYVFQVKDSSKLFTVPRHQISARSLKHFIWELRIILQWWPVWHYHKILFYFVFRKYKGVRQVCYYTSVHVHTILEL